MSSITATSFIKKKVDVTDQLDLSNYPNCVHCGRRPQVFEITWGSRSNKGQIVECCEAGGGWLENWKRFNSPKRPDCPIDQSCNRLKEIEAKIHG